MSLGASVYSELFMDLLALKPENMRCTQDKQAALVSAKGCDYRSFWIEPVGLAFRWYSKLTVALTCLEP